MLKKADILKIASGIFLAQMAVLLFSSLGGVIQTFLIAFLLSFSLTPIVDYLQRFGIPRFLSAILCLVFILSLFVVVILIVSPILITQTNELTHWVQDNYTVGLELVTPYIPEVSADKITEWIQGNASSIGQAAQEVGNFLISSIGVIFSSVLSALTIALVAFFYLIDKDSIKKLLDFLLPSSKVARMTPVLVKKAESWIFGQLALMFIVALLNLTGFLIIGLEYAVPLALINGILEVVPIVGPIVGGIFPIIVGFSEDPVTGVGALGVVIIVQQIENNILVPKVMGSVVGLSPNVSLFSFMVGATLFGLIGGLLAIPAALFLIEVGKTVYKKPAEDFVENFTDSPERLKKSFLASKRKLRLLRYH
jgi:predicted PurR-regulated permease PerM